MPRFLNTLALLLLTLSFTGCGPMTITLGGKRGGMETTTVVADPGARNAKVAMIDITGLIFNATPKRMLTEGENPVSFLHEKLKVAAKDRDVKAVVLRINSPGGGVTATDMMFVELERFQKRTGKPVVALLMDVAASGGYYLACGADEIVAYPTSVTGSIGVITQTVSVKNALARLGVQTDSITSGPNKDLGSPLSTPTPGHREVFEQLVDDFYGRFTSLVRERRPNIAEENFAMVTDGRVFSGARAAELGLVDQTGDLYLAYDRAKALAGVRAASLVHYHRPMSYVGSPYAAAPATGVEFNMAKIDLDLSSLLGAGPGIYYLWRP